MDLDSEPPQPPPHPDPQALAGDGTTTSTTSEKHTLLDDASLHTIAATSLQTPPVLQNPSLHHSNPMADERPRTSYSDTGFASRPYSQSADNTPDHSQLQQQPSQQQQQQNGNGLSRPQSQSAADGQRQQAQKNSSVVIKVGMVGDAQIGKTSLMVKYVEGSWDEDYIQTLGTTTLPSGLPITRQTR